MGKSQKGNAPPAVKPAVKPAAAGTAKPGGPDAKPAASGSAPSGLFGTAKPAAKPAALADSAAKAAVFGAAKPGSFGGAKLAASGAAKPAAKGSTKSAKGAAKTDPKPKKLPLVAVKPARPTRPSLPPPPPTAPSLPPAHRDEMPAPRDIARLTRYGERFGPHKIDVRWLPLTLPVAGTALAVFDPGAQKSWRVFDRPVGAGTFRAMLSIARSDDGKERLSAIVIHVGRPPIERWSVAHYKGQKKPKAADQLPRAPVTTGWVALIDAGKDAKDAPGVVAVPPPSGLQPIEVPLTDGRKALALPCGNGEYAAYWAVDAGDKPICLVLDFDVFSQKDWKSRPPQ